MKRPVVAVRLGEHDRRALETHFAALDAEDRRLRFGAPIGDLAIRQYIARIDFNHDRVFAVRDDSGRVIAVVHVAIGDRDAEIGLSVLPGHRRAGIGGALFARAVMHLRNHRIRAVRIHCLAENTAIMHLARRYRMRIVFAGGESDASLVIAPPTTQSLFAEWLHDRSAEALEIARWQAFWFRMLSGTR